MPTLQTLCHGHATLQLSHNGGLQFLCSNTIPSDQPDRSAVGTVEAAVCAEARGEVLLLRQQDHQRPFV